MQKFIYNNITEYQLEITTYCNAACPQCPRNINGGRVNPYLPLDHLPRATIDAAFPTELCQQLKQIFFCGSYGDAIMHPEFLDILRDFRRKSPTLWLYIHTNGGVHDADYWTELAGILKGYGKVDFGIDGLEDTLHLYRRNVSYNRVIENASAFIAAGGKAQWNYIVFKHNEHQVEQAKEVSRLIGFEDILIRKTGRFFDHASIEEMSSWPVQDKKGNIEYYLEPPTISEHKNRSMVFLPNIKNAYSNMKEYFDTTKITCDALKGNKVLITAQGLVLPCTFFNHMYDVRFQQPDQLPRANPLTFVNNNHQVREFLESYGLDNLSIQNNSLETIFNNPMWDDLVASFGNPLDQGRLFECAMTCGSKLTKVWDQGGSTR